jgi:hypothetical protein
VEAELGHSGIAVADVDAEVLAQSRHRRFEILGYKGHLP